MIAPTPIIAFISGTDTAAAKGVTVNSTTPVLELCRALVAAGHDPRSPLRAYRGDTLALIVTAIGTAARLEVSQRGTGFIARHDRRAAPPIAPNAPARASVAPACACARRVRRC
jgi:hypothetical protein